VGEGQSFFERSASSIAIDRRSAIISGILRVGLGRAGQFTADNGLVALKNPWIPEIVAPLLTENSYDLMNGEGRVPRNTLALFGLNVLSSWSVTMAFIDSTTKEQVNIINLAKTIRVKIKIDKSMSTNPQSKDWYIGVSCAHYKKDLPDGIGQLSFSGCSSSTVNLETNFVECECDHLTEFVAAIDPSFLKCGDGIVQNIEKCDDGNTKGGDGCSASCQIEDGSVCWSVGTVPFLRSECCAPCDAGSYRVGCSFGGSESDGTCALCPANTYKPARGFWDQQCTDCPAGTRAGLGVTFCSEEESCNPGFYRPKKGDQCRACLKATYKSASGSPTEQCLDLIACTPGRYLTGFSKTSGGTCELCPRSTYKETIGIWSTICTPCPSGSSSSIMGSSQRDSCSCGTGYVKSIEPVPAFCTDFDECKSVGCSNTRALCINTPGSFSCVLSDECGDGFMFGDSDMCDDGNLANGDGCSSSCTIEPNFQCATATDVKSLCSCDPLHYTLPKATQKCSHFCRDSVSQAGSTAGLISGCTGHGKCAQKLTDSGDVSSGVFCLCDRSYFSLDCSVCIPSMSSLSCNDVKGCENDGRTYSIEYEVRDITASHLVQLEGFTLHAPLYAFAEPVAIIIDAYRASDLPAGLAAPARRRRPI